MVENHFWPVHIAGYSCLLRVLTSFVLIGVAHQCCWLTQLGRNSLNNIRVCLFKLVKTVRSLCASACML